MKNMDELLLQFNDIQELSISEEIMGAYVEGNLSIPELQDVEKKIHTDDRLTDLLSSISSNKENFTDNNPGDIFSEFDDETIYNINTLNTDIMTHLESQEDILGAAAAYKNFGEEGTGSTPNPDLLIYQGNEGVCAIRSQQIILRDYGVDVSLEELKQYAIQQGWYDPSENGGTPMCFIGALLESCGVGVRQQTNCTIYDLVNELAQGHRIIVGVDANELWADREGNIVNQTKEFFKDLFNEQANHALVVAGVDVNPNDPSDVKVILTDPGTGDLRIEYNLDDFMDAWEDSDCFMTTTTTPAPYQYDADQGRMVPSNFAVEQFVDTNSLPIQPDILIDYPDLSLAELNDQAAYADGHLDTIGHYDDQEVDYESFAAAHKAASHLSALGNVGALGQDHFDKDAFVNTLKSFFGFCSDVDAPDSTHTPAPATPEETPTTHVHVPEIVIDGPNIEDPDDDDFTDDTNNDPDSLFM